MTLRTATLLLITLAGTGCLEPVRETHLGNPTGGGSNGTGGGISSNGGGKTGGGTGGGNALQAAEGDATCDQSTCLPQTGTFGDVNVPQLTHDGPYLYGVLDLPLEYTGSLVRVDKATGARRVLYRDHSNPIDPNVSVAVRDGWVYFGKSWAGELWGVLSRVPVDGGAVQALADPSNASPAPVPFALGEDDSLVFGDGVSLKKTSPPSTVQSTLYTSTTRIRDIAIADGRVWFIDDDGAHRLPLSGGALEGTLSGAFRKLRAENTQVWGLRDDGAIVELTGATPATPIDTFVGATDFVRANGAFYAVIPESSSGKAQLVGSSGVLLEAHQIAMAKQSTATLAVDGNDLWLGTHATLAWKRGTAPTAVCGCAPTSPVLAPEAQVCMRNVCAATQTYTRGMRSGAFDTTHLWGVFYNSTDSRYEVMRVNRSGGAGSLTYSNKQNPVGVVGVDETNVYVYDGAGALDALDKSATTERQLATVDTRAEAPVALDGTHLYFVAHDGVRRVIKAGGQSELLASDAHAGQLALDDTHLYWVDDGRLRRAPKGGGAVQTLAQGFMFESGFGLSGGHAYFLTLRGLERVKKTGGFQTLVLSADKLAGLPVRQLAVQGADLLLATDTTPSNPTGALWRVKLSDGSRDKLLELGSGHTPYGLIVDSTVYALSSWQDTRWRERGCSCPAP